jgi:hypothetical protein
MACREEASSGALFRLRVSSMKSILPELLLMLPPGLLVVVVAVVVVVVAAAAAAGANPELSKLLATNAPGWTVFVGRGLVVGLGLEFGLAVGLVSAGLLLLPPVAVLVDVEPPEAAAAVQPLGPHEVEADDGMGCWL